MNFIFLVFFSYCSWSQFFSYTETSKSEMELNLPDNIPKAAMGYMSNMLKPQITSSKVYVHNNKIATVDEDRILIWDYEEEKVIEIDKSKNKYTSQSIKKFYKNLFKSMKKQSKKSKDLMSQKPQLSQDIRYIKTKKIKKISGVKCRIYLEKINTEIAGQKMKNNAVSCYAQNYPETLKSLHQKAADILKKNLSKKQLDFFMGQTQNYTSVFGYNFTVDGSAPQGFKIYYKSSQNFNPTQAEGAPSAMGQVKHKYMSKVSQVSNSEFSEDVFNVPEGYKKVKKL